MRELQVGDVLILKSGNIARITDFDFNLKKHYGITSNGIMFKLRIASACKGKYSSKKRIGLPYTYQCWTSRDSLKKTAVLIDTDTLIKALFMVRRAEKK